jgi:hypothetical protein
MAAGAGDGLTHQGLPGLHIVADRPGEGTIAAQGASDADRAVARPPVDIWAGLKTTSQAARSRQAMRNARVGRRTMNNVFLSRKRG